MKVDKKVALETEKDNDAAQKELQELQRVMEPKRARTNATTADDHDGCPGHGKGPWDGLGAMAKTKVTRDLTDGNVQTPSGRITSPLEVAQHLRAQFCSRQWKKDESGLTFQEWTPDVDTSRSPVAMLINSSELCAAGFKLKEVLPPALEEPDHVRTRGAGLRSLED